MRPSRTGKGEVFSAPLLQPGTELGWNTLAGAQPVVTALEAFKHIVFKDPGVDRESIQSGHGHHEGARRRRRHPEPDRPEPDGRTSPAAAS